MKKAAPFIVGGLILLLLVILVASNSSNKRLRQFDDRITLRQTDKIPYGTHVARELLPSLFPSAALYYDRKYPGGWDSLEVYRSNQAIVIVADYFDADGVELENLASFVERGNYVFLIFRNASDDLASFFNLTLHNNYFSTYNSSTGDSLQMSLQAPVFSDTQSYTYPGYLYNGCFNSVDDSRTLVLGRDGNQRPNFIRMDKGTGSFFLHTAPLAFSNYFILHKNNTAYYSAALSVLPKNINRVLWNEYFLEKPRSDDEDREPQWLKALLSQPAFKAGLLTALATLVLFMLLGMRRKQRMIAVYERPKNDSLDFVKTLGRLYYDRKDHLNLAYKMAAYFLEHVRSTYKLPTHTLDEKFILSLHYKSGYPEGETREIINTIHHIHTTHSITDVELSAFHRQLEAFYQNT